MGNNNSKNDKISGGGQSVKSIMNLQNMKANANVYDYENLYMQAYKAIEKLAISDPSNINLSCGNCPACQSTEMNINGVNYAPPHCKTAYVDVMLMAYHSEKYNIFSYKSLNACSNGLLSFNNNFILKNYPFPLQSSHDWRQHFGNTISNKNEICILISLSTLYGLENIRSMITPNYILSNVLDIYMFVFNYLENYRINDLSFIAIGVDIFYIANEIKFTDPYDFSTYSIDLPNILNEHYFNNLCNVNKRNPFNRVLLKDVPQLLLKLLALLFKIKPDSHPKLIHNIIIMSKLIGIKYYSSIKNKAIKDIIFYPGQKIKLSGLIPVNENNIKKEYFFNAVNEEKDLISFANSNILSDIITIGKINYNTLDNSTNKENQKCVGVLLSTKINDWSALFWQHASDLAQFIEITSQYLQCESVDPNKAQLYRTLTKYIGGYNNYFPKILFDQLDLFHFLMSYDDYVTASVFSELKQAGIDAHIVSNDRCRDWYMYYLPKDIKELSLIGNNSAIYNALLAHNFIKTKDGKHLLHPWLSLKEINIKCPATELYKTMYRSKDAKFLQYFAPYITHMDDGKELNLKIVVPLPVNSDKSITAGLDKFTVESYVQKINIYDIKKTIINRDLDSYVSHIPDEIDLLSKKKNFSLYA